MTRLLLIGTVVAVFLEKFDLQLEQTLPVPTPIFTTISTAWLISAVFARRTQQCGTPAATIVVVMWAISLLLASSVRTILDLEGAGSPTQLMLTTFHWLQFASIAIAIGALTDRADMQAAMRTVLACSALGAAIGLLQVLDLNAGGGQLSEALDLRSRVAEGYARPVSIFSEPAYYGFFCLYGVAITHADILRKPWMKLSLRFWLLASALSTAAFGPLLVSIVYLITIAILSGRKAILYLILVGAATAIVASTPIGSIAEARIARILNETDASSNVRSAINEASIALIAQNPLLGVGPGQVRYVLPNLVDVPGVNFIAYNQAGNSYLAVLLDQGVFIGAILFFSFFLHIWACRSLEQTRWSFLLLIIFAVSWLSVSTIALPVFWLLFGMTLAALRLSSDVAANFSPTEPSRSEA